MAAPLEPPLQETFVCDAVVMVSAVGWVMVNDLEVVHPLASVAVQIHVPAIKPLTDLVPSPVGVPGVQS